MQRRFFFSGLLAALALSAAACADETPTFVGEENFPPGSIPVTREVILPASAFYRYLGSFTGFSRASELPFVVVANEFGEGLNAHALARFAFPATVTYTRNGAERRDELFSYAASSLLVRVDTAASTPGPVTLQVWQVAQEWDRASATWTAAADTGAVETAWTEPGGTRGALLAEATFQNSGTGGDSLVFALAAADVAALADSATKGLLITTSTAGARVQLTDVVLRAAIRPDSAAPDTTIVQALGSAGSRTTLYTPEQPEAGPGMLAVGGVRGARTLLELNPDQPVPGCPVGDTCATVPLRDVLLNEVAVLLRPADVPGGFDRLSSIPLSLRAVSEPELGAATPLGPRVLDVDPALEIPAYLFGAADSLAVLPITNLARSLAANDSITRTFALVSEVPGSDQPPTFGVALFQAEPRLRIVYTLPARRRLP